MPDFKLASDFEPKGDQPMAIEALVSGVEAKKSHQTLLGITGSGKTFTMANVIERLNRPTLVISHNKTLAAQLYTEFKTFFPHNAVEYFVSYYDYYMPEAYIPQSDTYIAKETHINRELEKMRNSATRSLMTRRDVIVVASVSCMFGLGSPAEYEDIHMVLRRDQEADRDAILRKLVDLQYERNDMDLQRGKFRVKGDVVEVFPSYDDTAVRIDMFGDSVERISEIDPLKSDVIREMDDLVLYPAMHFVTSPERMEGIMEAIKRELEERVGAFTSQGMPLEAERLEQRTNFDLEMLAEVGYCSGIENYSLYMDGRQWGETPYTLLDYFPEDYIIFIDESHVTIPQIRGMYFGDRSRKEVLVKYGFRLPSALENRPLTFEEFDAKVNQAVYVSATPAAYELGLSEVPVEQIIRPTGLVDPVIEVRPKEGQIDDLLGEIRTTVDGGERVLVTTLTKRMAEDLAEYYADLGVRVRYLHSEIDTLDRVDILRDLQLGKFDVLVGINLLREGLDLPQVSLVAILDADRQGYLRTETSLIQTIGRASRNVNGRVLMYADVVTGAMKFAIEETGRRRALQVEYNEKHGIRPETIVKQVREFEERKESIKTGVELGDLDGGGEAAVKEVIREMDRAMKAAAKRLDFERAAALRDKIRELKDGLAEQGSKN